MEIDVAKKSSHLVVLSDLEAFRSKKDYVHPETSLVEQERETISVNNIRKRNRNANKTLDLGTLTSARLY